MQGRGILTVVDATNNLRLEVLQYRPFLVKPNQHELGEIFGVKLETQEDVIPYAGELQEKGAVLCTAGFGLATGQIRFFFGAFYLFFINSVFIVQAYCRMRTDCIWRSIPCRRRSRIWTMMW